MVFKVLVDFIENDSFVLDQSIILHLVESIDKSDLMLSPNIAVLHFQNIINTCKISDYLYCLQENIIFLVKISSKKKKQSWPDCHINIIIPIIILITFYTSYGTNKPNPSTLLLPYKIVLTTLFALTYMFYHPITSPFSLYFDLALFHLLFLLQSTALFHHILSFYICPFYFSLLD